jgi:hypothetical protein
MITKEFKRPPYSEMGKLEKLTQSSLEIPTSVAGVIRRRFWPENISSTQIESNLREALTALSDEDKREIGTDPHSIQYISKGAESHVFLFKSANKLWVVKVGHQRGFTSGVYAPNTKAYADISRWNYEIVEEASHSKLPHLLPKPYIILDPDQSKNIRAMQIAPYIPSFKITDLPEEARQILQEERLIFAKISNDIYNTYGVIPDVIGSNNLIIAQYNGKYHLTLVDIGLAHKHAPTPILNQMYRALQPTLLVRDMIRLRKRK